MEAYYEVSSTAGPYLDQASRQRREDRWWNHYSEQCSREPQEGLVVAIGNGKRLDDGTLIEVDLKKGDRILFGKYSGSEVNIDGEEHLILREDEILGVMEK